MSRVVLDSKEWFFETSFSGVRRCKFDAFRIEKDIYKGKTPFQDIHIFKSRGFGRMLALDGIIQLSEADEFIYHEMIVHPILLSHPQPRRLLIIGGGDGGVLREAVKYPLEEIYQVEIDAKVVEVCKSYLPFISKGAFSDKRLSLHFEDGKRFISKYKDFFDVVIVDSTDPVGPGKVLFRTNFYRLVYEALTADGVATFQLGPFLDFDLIIRKTANTLKKIFRYVKAIRLPMPSYSCGCEYCFLMVAKKTDLSHLSSEVIQRRLIQRLGSKVKTLKYYTPQIHTASMILPSFWQV